MASINGLRQISTTSIQNAGQIYLGNSLDSGTPGQVIISNGPQQAVSWGSNSATLPGALTAGTNLSLASGNASFDGTIADTLNATALTITGGKGISVVAGTEILTDNDNTTINNSGGTGNQNQVLKVPNALVKGTNITFSSGTTYDGSSAITIGATNTDTTYQGSSTININTATSPDTINCLKVPNVMTASTNIIFTNTDDGASASSYDGSQPITIRATDTDTTYQGSSTISIDTSTTPDTINALKVPNTLTASTNIIFTNTDDGAAASSYDGSQPITIRATDTNTEYTAGTNLNLAGTTFNLDTSITTQTGITFLNNGASTNLTGSNYPNKPTIATNLDLSSSTNIMPLPPDCFEVSGDIRQTINLSIFMPDDDSSFYNIGVEDDLSSKIHGSLRILNSSIEVCGFMVIPNGVTAVAARIDATNSSGAPITRTINYESFTTYGATGFSALYAGTTNSEQTFSSSMAAASDKLLLIRINTTTTSDHIRGGYIKLTRN